MIRHDSATQGKSFAYEYDAGGNILSKSEYDYTTGELGTALHTVSYTYGDSSWGDLLTAYNGQAITYDAIGNPTSYLGWNMTWQGRRLTAATKDENALSFTYDANGIRTSKTVNGVTTEYFLNGSQILAQKTGESTMWFFYDSEGNRIGMIRNGYAFYYMYNLQGDVIGLMDARNGRVVARYSYDAWGNCTVQNADGWITGDANPFRYRGYYYDTETGFYYVSSRYYDPEIGRFISPDTTDVLTATPVALTDKNLYAYCDNNPVMRVDLGGRFWESVFDVISLGASIVEVCINPADPWAWAGLVGDTIDLIPFVTGVGEVTRSLKTVDKVADTVQIAKAVDFTEDAADIVKTLDRSNGFTKSTASLGRKIHDGYKVGDGLNPKFKESRKIRGVRPDYIDFDNKIIYELKPMNPRSVRSGIRQLQRYNKAFGGGFTLRLELY